MYANTAGRFATWGSPLPAPPTSPSRENGVAGVGGGGKRGEESQSPRGGEGEEGRGGEGEGICGRGDVASAGDGGVGAWWLAGRERRWGVCRQAGIVHCWELLRSTEMPLLLL